MAVARVKKKGLSWKSRSYVSVKLEDPGPCIQRSVQDAGGSSGYVYSRGWVSWEQEEEGLIGGGLRCQVCAAAEKPVGICVTSAAVGELMRLPGIY